MTFRSPLPRPRSPRAHSRTRRIPLLLTGLVSVTALALSACSPATTSGADDDRPLVLTTFTVLKDIAANVAGDHLRVESITQEGAEIHGYEPSPSDIRHAEEADLVLENGMGLEKWFEQFIDVAGTEHVVLSEGITPIDITEDADAGKPNPHAWMSPSNTAIYVENMVTAFSDLAPDHAADFEANAEDYTAKLTEVETNLADTLAALPENQRALVTCEGAFSYLARDAGLTEKYIWPVNAEHEATPQQVASAIEFVRDNDVPAVFCESTVNDKAMQQVVDATDATFGGTLYVDSLTTADGPVPSYLDLITHDAETIADALTGAQGA
ncbi:metal ABC transporter substrate-binding protein [Brevibacterium gallinarum]|uniref:Metal ABC transporter substrate-binding protein n=1 Tax=Brevibacterium gallinarum TaxID=2762220 RepID=A0ABR8WXM3_9MICO|nr:metal ABC transporter substrate-binding protein [Brevibacterium gallinarum]